MFDNFKDYKRAYSHLWQTYGRYWQIRLSFVLELIKKAIKFIALPISVSLIIADISSGDFNQANKAVIIFIVSSFAFGVLTPLISYVGMIGENEAYKYITNLYFSKLLSLDIDYFNSNLSGYLTTSTRQYVDSCMIFIRLYRNQFMGTILSIIMPIIIIFKVNLGLGFVSLILSLVQACYLIWASKIIQPYRAKAREEFKINSGFISDAISNILAIKSSSQEIEIAKKVKDGSEREELLYRKRYIVNAKLTAVREFITVIFFAILLRLTLLAISSGQIGIAGAVLAVTYATTIMTGIYSLSSDLD